MTSIELQRQLEKLLLDACLRQLECMKNDLENKSIFSYSIYCSSGFRNMGVAAGTREGFSQRKRQLSVLEKEHDWYAEVNAAEWDYVNQHYEIFSEVDTFIDELYTIFYGGYLDDVNLDEMTYDKLWGFISTFFSQVICSVITSLLKLNAFSHSIFENDLLLGVQFGDPDIYCIDSMLNISSHLNNDFWHSKVVLNCEAIKKGI